MKRFVYHFAFVLTSTLLGCQEQEFHPDSAGQFELTVASDPTSHLTSDAEVTFFKGGEKQFSYTVESGRNQLFFEGDPEASYTVVVNKPGHLPYSKEFRFGDLKAASNKRFVATLKSIHAEPAFPIMPTGDFSFGLAFKGSGSVIVDWGDGTRETFSFEGIDGNVFHTFHHDYLENPYPIIITGDLDHIVEYANDYYTYYSTLEYIDPVHLNALTNFFIHDCKVKELDLSRNRQLIYLELAIMKLAI